MGVTVKYPITVHVDNVGDILLSDEKLVYQQTYNIDMHHHFISDYVERVTVKTISLIRRKPDISIHKEPK